VEGWLILDRLPDVEGVGDECGWMIENGAHHPSSIHLELGSKGGCCNWGCCCFCSTGKTSWQIAHILRIFKLIFCGRYSLK